MIRKTLIQTICIFALCLCVACENKKHIALTQNGNALMPIVIADTPTKVDEHCAKELKTHLDKISDCNFQIIKESELSQNAKAIFVGNTQKSKVALPDFNPQKVPFDTIRILTKDGSLFITGHHRRGTIYATSEFLESLGVRWWTPQEMYLPKNASITLKHIDKTYSPALQFRQTNYISGSFDALFAMRMKNGQLIGSDKQMNQAIAQSRAVPYHSFYKILPPKKYFKKHPEWFSEIDGKRTHQNAQLCLTNEEMTKEFIKVVREKLAKMPYARFAHISQNDWRNPCDCKKCKDFEDAHGGVRSATMVNFANKIADAVKEDYPDLRIVTFAYQYTRKAPQNIKPRNNVWIELCTIECDFAHSLESDTYYSFTQDIKDWSKLTKNLTIWNYTTCFSNYIIPYPNMYLIGDDIRFFIKNGAIGLFEQGDSFCNVGDFMPLRLWVMSKLMWDPTLDDKTLIDEFLNGYYGNEIAKIYWEYLDTINNRASSVHYTQGCDYIDTFTWMDAKTYNKASTLMAKALQTAKRLEKENPTKYKGLIRKVWKDKITIDYVGVMYHTQLKRMAEREGIEIKYPKDVVASAQDIINRFNNFKTERIVPYMTREKFESIFPAFLSFAKEQKKYLTAIPKASSSNDLLKYFKEGTFADFQEDRIEISGNGWAGGWLQIPPEYVKDENASNGWSAKNHYCKRFEVQLRDNLLKLKSSSGNEKNSTFKIYAFIKNPAKDIPAGKLTWLHFNPVGKENRRVQRLPAPAIPHSDKYQMIEIGTFDHYDITSNHKDMVCRQFLLYTGKNSPILIDRIVFVRN